MDDDDDDDDDDDEDEDDDEEEEEEEKPVVKKPATPAAKAASTPAKPQVNPDVLLEAVHPLFPTHLSHRCTALTFAVQRECALHLSFDWVDYTNSDNTCQRHDNGIQSVRERSAVESY